MITFTDRFTIRVTTTAAYAPFSNGIVERHNGVLKTTMSKIGDDGKTKCLTSNTKLAYAVMAKNSLLERHTLSNWYSESIKYGTIWKTPYNSNQKRKK